jgi:hypothetical protein
MRDFNACVNLQVIMTVQINTVNTRIEVMDDSFDLQKKTPCSSIRDFTVCKNLSVYH